MIEKDNVAASTLITPVLKSIFSKIPIIGITIDMYDKYQSTIQYNNIVDALKKHEEQLEMLNDKVLDMKYISSDKHINDIVIVCQKVKDELNKEKRDAYARYLTAGCLRVNNPNSNKEIYLDYIGRMDFMDIFILKSLSDDLYDWNSIEKCERIFEEHFPSSNSSLDFEIHLDHLKSLGLIKYWDESETELFPLHTRNTSINRLRESLKKEHLYIKTSLGKALISYISIEGLTEDVK